MNPFFHNCMFPVIYKMAIADQIAREQVQAIRREAERLGISEKYCVRHCITKERDENNFAVIRDNTEEDKGR